MLPTGPSDAPSTGPAPSRWGGRSLFRTVTVRMRGVEALSGVHSRSGAQHRVDATAPTTRWGGVHSVEAIGWGSAVHSVGAT